MPVAPVHRFGCAIAAALMLSACGSKVEEEPNIAPPASYKTKLILQMRDKLQDPTGVRDAALSEPALMTSGTTTRYISCLRYTARDEDGRYLPPAEKAVYFYASEINQITDAPPGLCRGAAYQPWPELMKLCREAVCPGR